jgi:hypothetical protein
MKTPIYLLLFLVIFATACNRKNTRVIESPYQQALNAYYQGLQNNDLKGAEKILSRLIIDHSDDANARTLYAQVLLDSLRKMRGNSPLLQRKIIQNLQILAFDPPAKEDPGTGWVLPRTYTLFGDLLLVRMQELLTQAGTNETWRGYLLARAAEFYYRAAYDAATDPKAAISKGLAREKENAISGLLQAQFGIIEALKRLDAANSSPQIKKLSDGATQLALRLSENNLQNLPLGNPAYLKLEKTFQRNLKILESNISTTSMIPAFTKLCSGGSPSDLEKAWIDILAHTQKSAIHNELYNLIAEKPENDLTPILLLHKFLKNPKPFDCNILSED